MSLSENLRCIDCQETGDRCECAYGPSWSDERAVYISNRTVWLYRIVSCCGSDSKVQVEHRHTPSPARKAELTKGLQMLAARDAVEAASGSWSSLGFPCTMEEARALVNRRKMEDVYIPRIISA